MKGKKRILELPPEVKKGNYKELKLTDFDIQVPPLGQGAFGTVSMAIYKKSRVIFAIKFIKRK